MTLGAERSQLLVRANRILIAAGVLAAGLLAAWPFRQPAAPWPRTPAAPLPLELTLRRQEVALSVSAPSDQSPAAGLDASPKRSAPAAGQPSATKVADAGLRLEQLTPPPELPVAFHNSSASVAVDRADDAKGSSRPPAAHAGPLTRDERTGATLQRRPRIHYVRDGDSLESLAERFLGSRERASEIFEANRGTLSRPELLPVGTKIVIPPRDGEAAALTGPATPAP